MNYFGLFGANLGQFFQKKGHNFFKNAIFFILERANPSGDPRGCIQTHLEVFWKPSEKIIFLFFSTWSLFWPFPLVKSHKMDLQKWIRGIKPSNFDRPYLKKYLEFCNFGGYQEKAGNELSILSHIWSLFEHPIKIYF